MARAKNTKEERDLITNTNKLNEQQNKEIHEFTNGLAISKTIKSKFYLLNRIIELILINCNQLKNLFRLQ